ncbi:MBL fold metallo-hydrolase [Bythopirellula polymerisocia]|uniref:Putative L-ascorbate-6-phosphate lactonase UlaG n=1 Tax=Bythopirellula polymerisocia TaxID=2528003 RepID=A0A5C6CD67_9BACT|nr:MBL fold metallo-hydrolase [Bythopirellula polymerisocia]TWU21381.1 putative L-ascorbate-6-phosphate lactonase UlaG [Bythopirellula polymerisocia]
MKQTELNVGVKRLFNTELEPGTVGLAWLGQAGFALRYDNLRMLIDPYLSDHLAKKYRGQPFSHVRLMEPPIEAEELGGIDLVLCTHGHSDHMDPDALAKIASHNSSCRFLVPRSEMLKAKGLGLPEKKLIGIDAGENFNLAPGISVTATRAAHEDLRLNENGESFFLGYVLKLGDRVVYHSGDTIPFEGLVEELAPHQIEIALLPVNGRDDYRTSHGIPGNMTCTEARNLCLAAEIPHLVPHHFGMFDFNTADDIELNDLKLACREQLTCLRPEVNQIIVLSPRGACILQSQVIEENWV